MGMSEEEFFNTCPIFFNEQLEVYYKDLEKGGALKWLMK